MGGGQRSGVGRARPRNGRGPERGPSRSAGAVGLGPGARPRRARSPESGSSGPWPPASRRHPHVRRRVSAAGPLSLRAGPGRLRRRRRAPCGHRVSRAPETPGVPGQLFPVGALAPSSLQPVPSRPVLSGPSLRRFLVFGCLLGGGGASAFERWSLGWVCGPASPRDVLILELGPFHLPSNYLKKRSKINLRSPICTEAKNLGCDWKKKKGRSCG